MGQRGPAPQAAELRLLKGNFKDKDQAGTKVRRQPKATLSVPPKPDDLGEHGSRMWDLVSPELERMGVLGRIDLGALEAYCVAYEHWKTRPFGPGWASFTMTMVNIGSKLGLDPAARLRMTLAEEPDGEEQNVFGQG